MSLYQRVSDERWTIDERMEVLEVFMERANLSLQGKLFEDEDLSDPNSGISYRLVLSPSDQPGLMTITNKSLRLPLDEYDKCIHQLRPFILREQDIFLPKITQHIMHLLKKEHIGEGEKLTSWIEEFVSFEKEFAPNFYYSFYKTPDGKKYSFSSAELARNYIYGRSVKIDIPKRRNLKQAEQLDMLGTNISDALNLYLKQLMKLVLVTKNSILYFRDNEFFIEIVQNKKPDW